MIYIGIDPGKNGGIAWIDETAHAERLNGKTVTPKGVEPSEDEPLAERLRFIVKYGYEEAICYVEDVHAMPGQGSVSGFNFGKTYGFILGTLNALRIPYKPVTPMKWKKAMKVTSDKKTSIRECKRLFPDVDLKATARSRKDHDGMAEALLIAEYGRRSFENSKH